MVESPAAQAPKAIFSAPEKFAPPSPWLYGVAGFSALVACAFLRATVGESFPASAVFPVLLMAFCLLLVERSLGRPRIPALHPRHRAAARLGLLAYLFVPIAGVSLVLIGSEPLQIRMATAVFTGTANWLFASLLSFPFSVVAALITLGVGRASSSGLNRILARLATASSLLLVVLSAAGVARCIGRVEPDKYLASLPVAGRVQGNDPQPLAVQGVQLRIDCASLACAPEVVGGAKARKIEPDSGLGLPLSRDEPVVVLSDSRSGVVILRSVKGSLCWVLDLKAMRFTESLTFFEVSKSISPPRAWVGFGCLASIVSLALLAFGKRHTRRRGLMGGTADGTGRIVVGDGDAFSLRPALVATTGPVTVRLTGVARRQRGGPYRAATPQHATSTVWAGTVDDVMEWLRDEASAHYASALVLNCFAAIPLIVSEQRGLLF